ATQLFSGGQRQAHRALAKHAIPADYEWRAFVRAGGLMSSSTKNRARPAMRASSRAQIRPICGTRTLRKKRYRWSALNAAVGSTMVSIGLPFTNISIDCKLKRKLRT